MRGSVRMGSVARLLVVGALLMPGVAAGEFEQRAVKAEICIYGGTASGVAAAVAAAREGRSVVLIEPGRHLGGMSSGGLGQTDFGNKVVIGGLARSFYRRVGEHYRKEEAWQFEPSVAEGVFRKWVAEHGVEVLFEHRLNSVEKEGRRIRRLVLEKALADETGAPAAEAVVGDRLIVEGEMFIDAGYEGDLLARAGVSYHVGRESVRTYGESLNGIRAETPKHQFVVRVDPYRRIGDPSSGLLPLIQEGDGGRPGDGDHRVQAYNFRMCLTDVPENRIEIPRPADYDEGRYEVLARYLENLMAAGRPVSLGMLIHLQIMPNRKTDINNNGAVSTDHIGFNYEYPEADYATRSRIWKEHQRYIHGLFYFLGHSPRVPENVREEMRRWGFAKDEFQDTGGWPHQMYVREARRMIGRYVITQHDCEHARVAEDSVGMGAYNMDSHNCQRIVNNGAVENEGDVQVRPAGPYPISYRAITPKAEECENLLVPVCLSASHIAYGSARMEPVFMVLGESAALAACQALEEGKSVQEIHVPRLQRRLVEAGQVIRNESGVLSPEP